MRTFKEIITRDDEWQNLKNVAYCTLGVVTLVIGTFVGAFTTSLLDSQPTLVSDIQHNTAYQVTLAD